jgi:membrane-bound metal-dependent hydrolase YbcI (DUF457 family)
VKGIAHFISGIAMSTFIPAAVRQAASGTPVLALGGLFGLLPDTLDFKLARYFERYDYVIDPDPRDIRPQAIAEQVAGAMRAAFETNSSKTLMLHTIRLGTDLWREYSLRFNPETDEVLVRVGPIVNTSQAALPGSEPAQGTKGRASVGVPMVHTYDAETKINIFSGPSFQFEKHSDAVHVTFLPWHRRWSHSLTLAAAIGLAVGGLLGPIAGLVSGLGYATHVLQDQLGFMGSNLFWPLTRRRTHGLRLLRSGDALPNFLAVWLSVALILFNLDRFSTTPRLPALPFLLATVLLPLLVLSTLYTQSRRKGKPSTTEAPGMPGQCDILSETEEIEL